MRRRGVVAALGATLITIVGCGDESATLKRPEAVIERFTLATRSLVVFANTVDSVSVFDPSTAGVEAARMVQEHITQVLPCATSTLSEPALIDGTLRVEWSHNSECVQRGQMLTGVQRFRVGRALAATDEAYARNTLRDLSDGRITMSGAGDVLYLKGGDPLTIREINFATGELESNGREAHVEVGVVATNATSIDFSFNGLIAAQHPSDFTTHRAARAVDCTIGWSDAVPISGRYEITRYEFGEDPWFDKAEVDLIIQFHEVDATTVRATTPYDVFDIDRKTGLIK